MSKVEGGGERFAAKLLDLFSGVNKSHDFDIIIYGGVFKKSHIA